MQKLFLNICYVLDPLRKEKCNEFFNEIFSTLNFIINSKLFLIILALFVLILINLIVQKYNTKYSSYFLPIFIFCLFCTILVNFNTNIPWVDDWEWIENLQTKKKLIHLAGYFSQPIFTISFL